MDIIVNGYFNDGSHINSYIAHIGDYVGENDDHIFYYFDTDGEVVGEHHGFVITDFERA